MTTLDVGGRFPHFYIIVFNSDLLRFQRFPLWRPFSKVYDYSVRFRRIRVDEAYNRNHNRFRQLQKGCNIKRKCLSR